LTPKDQNSTLFPTQNQKKRKHQPSNPSHSYRPQHPVEQTANENTTATVRCESTTKNAAANVDSSYGKTLTPAGLCSSLKTLRARLNKTFNSPEVTQAFETLRVKMEKDYSLKKPPITTNASRTAKRPTKKPTKRPTKRPTTETITCTLIPQTIMSMSKTYVLNTNKYVKQKNT
jgi:hypothetical protein